MSTTTVDNKSKGALSASPVDNKSKVASPTLTTTNNKQQANNVTNTSSDDGLDLSAIATWSKDMFSPELQTAISEIIPSADPLDDPNFNPVDYINNMFPNEQSLVDIDMAVAKIKSKVQRIDEDIVKEVRNQSRAGSKGKQDLGDAKRSIHELFGKIRDIKSKAEQSERMVMEICRDIKSLDHAKKHLTVSITSLKRLHMLITGVEQLRAMVSKRQYREVGNLLEAVNQLLQGFSEYKHVPKIKSLNETVVVLKEDLNKQIFEEFNRFESQQSPAGSINLKDVCFVVEALGTDSKNAFFAWFIESQLRDYKQAFQPGQEVSRLDHIVSRYAWLKRELRYYDENYAEVFTPQWRVPEKIAEEFCITTRLALSELLETTKNTLDIVVLVQALQKTIEFEKELSTKFLVPGSAPVADDDEEEEPADSVVQEEDVGDYSAEAIRRKWKKHQEKKEKEVLQKKAAAGPPVQTVKFKGMISSCFDPYMELYIGQEDRNMAEMLERLANEETWTVPDEESNKVLSSSTDLIYYFNEARKRCSALTRGQPFFDLFLLFKKYLVGYCSVLANKIPGDSEAASGGSGLMLSTLHAKTYTEMEEKTLCLIVNTAEYCRATITQITETVKRMIDEKFKEKIDLSNEASGFSDVIARGLKCLVSALEGKLEPAMQAMTKVRWDILEAVGDQSGYVTQIDATVNSTTPMYRNYLNPAHFSFFCDLFIGSFVPRLIANIYKCKRISEVGAQHLLLDITSLKSVLLNMPICGGASGGVVPPRFTRLVNKEVGKAEALLKVILTPADSLVESYRTLMKEGNETDLEKILELKGIKGSEKSDQLKKYLTQTNQRAQTKPTFKKIAATFSDVF